MIAVRTMRAQKIRLRAVEFAKCRFRSLHFVNVGCSPAEIARTKSRVTRESLLKHSSQQAFWDQPTFRLAESTQTQQNQPQTKRTRGQDSVVESVACPAA
jgi:hypothetical protein